MGLINRVVDPAVEIERLPTRVSSETVRTSRPTGRLSQILTSGPGVRTDSLLEQRGFEPPVLFVVRDA
jgi:hypothetical protein